MFHMCSTRICIHTPREAPVEGSLEAVWEFMNRFYHTCVPCNLGGPARGSCQKCAIPSSPWPDVQTRLQNLCISQDELTPTFRDWSSLQAGPPRLALLHQFLHLVELPQGGMESSRISQQMLWLHHDNILWETFLQIFIFNYCSIDWMQRGRVARSSPDSHGAKTYNLRSLCKPSKLEKFKTIKHLLCLIRCFLSDFWLPVLPSHCFPYLSFLLCTMTESLGRWSRCIQNIPTAWYCVVLTSRTASHSFTTPRRAFSHRPTKSSRFFPNVHVADVAVPPRNSRTSCSSHQNSPNRNNRQSIRAPSPNESRAPQHSDSRSWMCLTSESQSQRECWDHQMVHDKHT